MQVEEGLDISTPEVLADIAARHDITVDITDHRAVIASWHEGQRRGVEGSPYFFAHGEGYFCPSLDIGHVDGRIVVTSNGPRRERFLDAVLRQTRAS